MMLLTNSRIAITQRFTATIVEVHPHDAKYSRRDELEGKNCVAEGENHLRDDYYSGLFLVDGEEEHDYFFAVKLSNIQFLED